MRAGRRTGVVVTGAASQIGRFLLPRLERAGYPVTALSRCEHAESDGARWVRADLARRVEWTELGEASTLIHLARLDLLPRHLTSLAAAGVYRLVAFGSTSRIVKAESQNAGERALAAALAAAEDQILDRSPALGIQCTLFLPTLIYGSGQDRSLSFIAAFVRRYRFFPLVAGGAGRRQPVHADDLAEACVRVLRDPLTYGKRYLLPGGETLSYREMVERVFRSLGMEPRFLPVPLGLLRTLMILGRVLPGYGHLNPEMAERMARDLCFDAAEAQRDFGYAPRRFELRPPARSWSAPVRHGP